MVMMMATMVLKMMMLIWGYSVKAPARRPLGIQKKKMAAYRYGTSAAAVRYSKTKMTVILFQTRYHFSFK
jgi:hypothetical protein